MNTETSLNNLFLDTSNSIRGKLNSTDGIKPINYPSTINTIPVGIIVPNGDTVEYTPTLSMVGDMATGVFVNLEDKTLHTNLATELNNADIIDSAVVYKGVTSNIIILSKNEDNGNVSYNLHNLSINSSGITLTDLELEQAEGFIPKRLVKLNDKIFALLSVGSTDEKGLDDRINIVVFDLTSQSNLKVYERTFNTSTAYTFNFNAHYQGTIAASETTLNYFIYFSYKASYSSDKTEPDTIIICNVAIPKNYDTLIGTREFANFSLGSGNVLGDVTDIIPIEGVYKNRMYVSITNNLDNKIYAVGLLGGTANQGHSVVSDLVRTGGPSRIIYYSGNYYLLNLDNTGNTLQYSEITLTNTGDTISTTCTSPSTLISFDKKIVLRKENPISIKDKMIFTFSYEESPEKIEYIILYKNNFGLLSSSSPTTFSTTNATNIINSLPNEKVLGIENDDYTSMLDLDSNNKLTIATLKIATPSVSTIDGITKTSAAKGEIGLAYILQSQD